MAGFGSGLCKGSRGISYFRGYSEHLLKGLYRLYPESPQPFLTVAAYAR